MKELILKVNCFHLTYTLTCGQCFRFQAVEGEQDSFYGVIEDRILKVTQRGDYLYISSNKEENLKEVVTNYFDLDIAYDSLEKEISNIDFHVKQAVKNSSGIHIVNQNFFEVLLSFIISANNNIPRITRSIQMISKRYGSEVFWRGDTYYLFPTPEQLKQVTEQEFRECGVGFRARYLVNTIHDVLVGNWDMEQIQKLTTQDLKKKLVQFQGVGEKVADCILLFACQRKEVFPVDVWVERVMSFLYFKEETEKKKKKDIMAFAKEHFGKRAGIVQQHLFFNIREKMIL